MRNSELIASFLRPSFKNAKFVEQLAQRSGVLLIALKGLLQLCNRLAEKWSSIHEVTPSISFSRGRTALKQSSLKIMTFRTAAHISFVLLIAAIPCSLSRPVLADVFGGNQCCEVLLDRVAVGTGEPDDLADCDATAFFCGFNDLK